MGKDTKDTIQGLSICAGLRYLGSQGLSAKAALRVLDKQGYKTCLGTCTIQTTKGRSVSYVIPELTANQKKELKDLVIEGKALMADKEMTAKAKGKVKPVTAPVPAGDKAKTIPVSGIKPSELEAKELGEGEKTPAPAPVKPTVAPKVKTPSTTKPVAKPEVKAKPATPKAAPKTKPVAKPTTKPATNGNSAVTVIS